MNNYANVLCLTSAAAPRWQSRGSGSASAPRPRGSGIIRETRKWICMEIGRQVETGPVEHSCNPALRLDLGDVFFSPLIAVAHL